MEIEDSTYTLEWPQRIAASTGNWQIGSLGNIYFEGENAMEKQLTDLVLALELDKANVSEIREIVGHSDWRERFMLYLLACAVKDGSVEVEALGYERKEK